jgi:hypothetical protein
MGDELKAVESGFGKKTFNRIFSYLRGTQLLTTGRPGWQKTDQGIVPPPFPSPEQVAATELWGISVADSELASVSLSRPGVLKRTSALDNSGKITITNETAEFTAVVGQFLLIELTPDLTAELKVAGQWLALPGNQHRFQPARLQDPGHLLPRSVGVCRHRGSPYQRRSYQ